MSVADTNGRIAQMVSDMHTILGMEISNSVGEATSGFKATLAGLSVPENEDDEEFCPCCFAGMRR